MWFFKRRPPSGTLAAIFVTPSAGQAMQPLDSVVALADAGLQGDRYATGRGFWKVTEACQVTLISRDDLQRAARRQPAGLGDWVGKGRHRRNLVVEGLKTGQLQGKRFRIGSAVFASHKPRPPCGYLDRIEGQGLCRALGRHSGICIRVVTGGRIRVGDPLEIIADCAQPSVSRVLPEVSS